MRINTKILSLSASTGMDYWKIFVTIALLLKVGMVSSVAEDYYNPDYDEDESSLNPTNWGEILPVEDAASPVKRHLGALAASASRNFVRGGSDGNLIPASRGIKYFRAPRTKSDQKGFSSPNIRNLIDENPRRDIPLDADVRDGSSDDIFDRLDVNPNSSTQFMATEARMKGKRFLGALARGGWFPRQFRGMDPQWGDKRNVGAVARLRGRKSDTTLKRNLGSLRKSKSGIPFMNRV